MNLEVDSKDEAMHI